MDHVKRKIVDAYETLAENYDRLIDSKPHNAHYDRPNTLALLPDVHGKSVLDVACGPGKYAEEILARGAIVRGFDISPKMIQLARKRNGDQGDFFVHDFSQPFHMLEDQSFDLVLCALAMHYIEDWTVTIKEFHRVLKPRGMVVLSIEHPFFEYNFFGSEAYFSVEQVRCTWKGFGIPVEVNSYRRSLQDCINPLTDHGFYIDKIVEPRPTPEFARLDPKHYRELNQFPAFMCIRAVKRD